MTKFIPLQPYKKFDVSYIAQLAKNGMYFFVSQDYARANHESDHSKKPVLFSPYKDKKEALAHYRMLKQNNVALAGIVDIQKPKITGWLVNLCAGHTDKLPYLAMVGNLESVNRYIDRHYYNQMRSWVRKNRSKWDISQPNSLQPSFKTIMGKPIVNIKWGSHSVKVKLEDLEAI